MSDSSYDVVLVRGIDDVVSSNGRMSSIKLFASVLLFAFAVPMLVDAAPSPVIDDQSAFFVPATNQVISARVLAWWTTNHGSESIGLPITSIPDDSGVAVQYFEYGAIELSADDSIRRIAVGSELVDFLYSPRLTHEGKHRPLATPSLAFRQLASPPSGDSVIFDETTRHSVKGSFASAYKRSGGVDVLGRPLTEAYRYGASRIQWFEFGKLIMTGRSAEVAPVGRELAVRSRANLTLAEAGDLRVVHLDRYVGHEGDGELNDQPTVFAPVRISIPAIEVDTAVENVPISDGVMQTPQDVWSVGWYFDLPAPGQYSNVVMAGHRDWWNVGPVVFYNLDLLAPGDMIYLTSEAGDGATYEVTEVQVVDADIKASEVVSDKGSDMLTLITCGGDFDGAHYLSRVIVYSVRI